MSDDNVTALPVVTRLNIPPERVIKSAIESDLDDIVVIGWDKAGDFYFASSVADGGSVLWLLELAKVKLLADSC